MMITAVITTYKRDAATVRRAAQSVLSQDYRPLELIIVDDNRNDEEGRSFSTALTEMIRELPSDPSGTDGTDPVDVRLTPTMEGKHGAQAARNTGICMAKGGVIAFLDDDDEWLPGKLTAQMRCLEENPDAGMIYCRGWRVDQAYDPPYITDFQGDGFRREAGYRDLLRGDCIGTTSQALIPKSTFEKVGGFDESLPARQDYEMWIRIASAFRIVGLDEHYFRYYKNGGGDQITRSWDRCIEGHKRLYMKYKKDIDSDRAAKFNVLFFLAHYYMCKNDKPSMIRYYAAAFFTSPAGFYRMGILKLESMKKDRELKRKNA